MNDPHIAAAKIKGYRGKPLTLMEVCGSHTHSIARAGIRNLLPPTVRLVSGPGCPVCLADPGYIAAAARLSGQARVMAFGDMARVVRLYYPGADITVCASPLDAVSAAAENRGEKIVFLSVGFETTNPVCAMSVLKAREAGLDNFSLLVCNKTMPAILEHVARQTAIDGFLLPGHVCAVTGTAFYSDFCRRSGVKGCVAGFDLPQLLGGLCMLLFGREPFYNIYSCVRPEGSPAACRAAEEVFRPCSARIAGIGEIEGAGLALNEEFSRYDASLIYDTGGAGAEADPACICGQVICGRAEPRACPLFGVCCTPDTPKGPCMVSGEGTCSAYYNYCPEALCK
ncbi:MAG: hydrogenase formation protein HypD [Abditibacteriota bacterium]|nr:hydrogenase formation protein HypD [Abditibacteriota bacterium]